MGELQKALDDKLQETPRLLLTRFFKKKLRAERVPVSTALVEQIVDHVLAGKTENIKIDDGRREPKDRTISITDHDVKDIDTAIARFVDSMPDLIAGLSDTLSISVLKTLKRNWTAERDFQAAEHREFRRRLETRWKKPLNLLRMLLTIAREFGGEIAASRASSADQSNANQHDVLTRLHVRACQVTAEVIVLLENGFADGAMARWRTLHEIGVVAALIAAAGDDTARRYAAHHAVEAKRGMEEFARCHTELGYEPLSDSSCQRIEENYAAAIAEFGPTFAGSYGWAASWLKIDKPSFRDLEVAVGRVAMRSHYKLASYNVHAGPNAAFFRLGLLDDSGVLLAGASNAGLSEPGQNAAHTLTQISALLLYGSPDLDQIVAVKVMQHIRNEIPQAFFDADKKLRRDDEVHKRKTRNRLC